MLANISVFCAKFLQQGKHWWFGWIWKGEGKVRLSSFKSKPMATLISLGRSSRDVPSQKLLCFRRMKLLHFTRFLVLIFLLCPHLFGRGENTEQLSLLFHAAVMLLVRSPEPCLYCPGQGWGSELPQWVLKLFLHAAESCSWQRFLVLCQTVWLHQLIACYKVISECLKIAMLLLIWFFE